MNEKEIKSLVQDEISKLLTVVFWVSVAGLALVLIYGWVFWR